MCAAGELFMYHNSSMLNFDTMYKNRLILLGSSYIIRGAGGEAYSSMQ